MIISPKMQVALLKNLYIQEIFESLGLRSSRLFSIFFFLKQRPPVYDCNALVTIVDADEL